MPLDPPLHLWARAYAETCVVEGLVHVALLRGTIVPLRRLVLVSWGLNTLTHPALWYAVPRFEPYLTWVAVAELGVWLTEAAALSVVLVRTGHPSRSAVPHALLVTLVANVVTTMIGLLRLG